MSILDILNELESVKTNGKVEILQRESDNYLLEEVFDKCYNPRIKYYIAKKTFPKYTPATNSDAKSLQWALTSLYAISNRDVTGHAAIDLLITLLSSLNVDDAEVLKRVVLGDLECKTSDGLAKRVWTYMNLYTPPQMLATAQSDKAIERVFLESGGDSFLMNHGKLVQL